MQNSHHQLVRQHWSLVVVVLLFPLLLAGAIPIFPTFDDWTSLVSPSDEPLFSKERFLFYGYHWRPFDSVFGYILGRNPQLLFPTLNHICVVTGHVAGTFLLYKMMVKLRLGTMARNVATLFFFLSPGMLATVLAVDGLNQTYANVWVLAAAVTYLSLHGWKKYALWLSLTVVATFCKENALMWFVITPLIAFAFDRIHLRQLRNDLALGLLFFLLYACAVIFSPSNIIIHPEYVPEIVKSVRDFFKFLLSTWFAVDFVALLHAPSRDIIVAAATLLLSLPLLYFLFVKNLSLFSRKTLLLLVLCQLIAVAPHIFTVFSMMHTYAGLAIAAIIVGTVVEATPYVRFFRFAFALYLTAAVFVDLHLWHESYRSGLTGKTMAQDIVKRSKTHPERAFLIIIEDDYPRLSSFCVVPSDALGWGRAVQYETNYEWPKELADTTLERDNQYSRRAHDLAQQKLKAAATDCVWIIDRQDVEIIPSD